MKKATFGWPFSWALDFAKLLMRQEQKPKRVSGFQMFVGQLQADNGPFERLMPIINALALQKAIG